MSNIPTAEQSAALDANDGPIDPVPVQSKEEADADAKALREHEYELVGRAVRYYAKASGDRPYSATITDAKIDPKTGAATVNLAVLESSGMPVNKTDVMLVKTVEDAADLEQYCVPPA